MFIDAPLYDAVLRGAILAAAALLWVVILSRVVGLRSFSKMTAFDFVATVATGSLLANAAVATDLAGFIQPMAAIAGLFLFQLILASMRQRSKRFRNLIDNRPTILMRNGVIDEAALRRTRVARDDVIAKMREANAGNFEEVRYVVLEATGDISVLHEEDVASELVADLD